MAFRLQHDEPVTQGLRRIVREQYRQAIKHLNGPPDQRQRAVHETRKGFKRIRSLLRLLREDMPTVFAVENTRIRELSAVLSPYRDADAMLETLEKLYEALPELLDRQMYDDAHAALCKARENTLQQGKGYVEDAATVLLQLRAACDRLMHWPFPDDLKHIAPVLRNTYKRARKAAKHARHDDDIEAFHAWRKRVKDLQYQFQLLQDMKVGASRDFHQQLKTLAEKLGNHHDLSILETLLDSPEIFSDRQHAAEVRPLVTKRRKQLERQTRELGREVFATPAKHFIP